MIRPAVSKSSALITTSCKKRDAVIADAAYADVIAVACRFACGRESGLGFGRVLPVVVGFVCGAGWISGGDKPLNI